jgi:uncharacterized short protein YbdD (DUF466 family)
MSADRVDAPQASPAGVASGPAEPTTGFGARWRAVCGTCRQIFGMPDYDRYLAHAAERHPGGPVMSRAEYCRFAIDRRYGKGGVRCC